ncbi:hypothetical protein [Saccharicrinis fermentans]|uniref:Transposase n=1 Tax=Saccharicrinis fermentans DSM 9555 = JCM 21142 TaxID=869213 RepID=W7Y7R4_9BACT|nr:hypothetical protein [Saccharicrinis fermentans]GAF03693.1 hypothetical protein JCM21142_62372 [Saccharicrinis fermentans DSM 9555 = JCM 21142]
MSRNYKFYNPQGVYFVSFAIVEWLDVFTRNKYKDILLEKINYIHNNPIGEGLVFQSEDYV